MLAGKKILLGVCGSIAAYKSAVLVRLLVKAGAEVKVVMTPSAVDFITPLTLATLSKNEVVSEFVKTDNGLWNNHVELGLWADLMVVAPASANTLAKLANGVCQTLLDATYLSARCPVVFAPAMDLDMLKHPATSNNLKRLTSFGNQVINPGFGELASGLIGDGRMAEPEEIAQFVKAHFQKKGQLEGKRALVTAGPTYEAIDPVRFIGNHSSGKMGFAIAEQLANQGAEVVLISGPTNQTTTNPKINLLRVVSAEEMFQACHAVVEGIDIVVLSAAVADYRPVQVADQKIKKTAGNLVIELTKTQDIAAALGKRKKAHQIIVGFALETENEKSNAEKKLENKNFDLIVLNSLRDSGAGFGHDTNKITIIDRNQHMEEFNLKSKTEVACDIVNAISRLVHAKT